MTSSNRNKTEAALLRTSLLRAPLLRKVIRQKRRDLSPHQQNLHAQNLAHLVCRHRLFLNAKRMACYLAEDGEIDPVHIIETAWQRQKKSLPAHFSADRTVIIFCAL